MELTCPSCQTTLRVADSDAGKQARCPKCQTVFLIPGGTSDEGGTSAEPSNDFGQGQPYGGEQEQASGASSSDQLGQSFSSGAAAGDEGSGEPPRWYLKIEDGRMFGPVPRTELDQWFKENRITANCELRTESELQWRPAGSVFTELGAPSAAAQNPFADSGQGSPYQTPSYGYPSGVGMEPHRGGMILTLGIVGLLCCQLLSIAAWVMGQSDLKKMREGRMDPSGQGLTNAGYILGIIGVVLMVLSIAANIFFAAVGGM